MLKLMLFLASMPLIPLALAHAPAPEGAGEAAEAVHCEIRATDLPGGIRLEGAVLSPKALTGSYAFHVEKRGGAGTSSSTQSGAFEAAAGEDIVGEVGLGLERGASYRAELTIRWPGGEAACVRTYPDRA